MTNPRNDEQPKRESKAAWERKHYNVQRLIAYGGLVGLLVLILQWWQMREALKIDERAWIEPVMLGVRTEIGKPFQAEFGIKNNGKTPALNVTMQSSIQLAVKGGLPDYSLLDKEAGDNSEYSRLIIYPNGQYTASSDAKWGALTQAHVDQIRSGDLRVFCFGRISYKDIFGQSHYAMFSTVFDPEKATFRYWRDGNTSSDN